MVALQLVVYLSPIQQQGKNMISYQLNSVVYDFMHDR